MSLKDPKTYLIGISCTIVALVAGWLNSVVAPASFVWVLTAIVIIAASLKAMYFWYLLARLNLAVIGILFFIGWIIAKPW